MLLKDCTQYVSKFGKLSSGHRTGLGFIPIPKRVMPMNVGDLISGSSAFSKLSLYIWKFLVHILLKPSLNDLEHNLISM